MRNLKDKLSSTKCTCRTLDNGIVACPRVPSTGRRWCPEAKSIVDSKERVLRTKHDKHRRDGDRPRWQVWAKRCRRTRFRTPYYLTGGDIGEKVARDAYVANNFSAVPLDNRRLAPQRDTITPENRTIRSWFAHVAFPTVVYHSSPPKFDCVLERLVHRGHCK